MSGRTVAALALAMFGLVCCPVTSPLAWWLGLAEAREVRRRGGSADDSLVASIAMWLGVLGTALGVLLLVLTAALGGLLLLFAALQS